MVFGYSVAGVSLESSNFGDFPSFPEVFVSLKGAGAVGDGDCDAEFPRSSSVKYMR